MMDNQNPDSSTPEIPGFLTEEDRAVWALPFEDIPAAELDAMDAEPALDIDAAWARLAATFPTPKRVPQPSLRAHYYRRTVNRRTVNVWRRHPVLWSSIALVAVWLLGVQLDRRYLQPLFYYHAGTTAQLVTLPDSSKVWLDPGAYLSTDRSFLTGARTVYLFGHARFAVAQHPARPFSVHVFQVQATALGTTFTVASDTTARVAVTVQDGKVVLDVLDSAGKRRHIAVLTAGQVQDIPAFNRWFAKVGYMLAETGVPLREAAQIQAALLRAAATTVPVTPGRGF